MIKLTVKQGRCNDAAGSWVIANSSNTSHGHMRAGHRVENPNRRRTRRKEMIE